MRLHLTKHHGLGNDFLVLLDLEGSQEVDAGLARALCDRHRGIGADGLIRASRPVEGAPSGAGTGAGPVLRFELYNADGSGAEMSGNGMRCLAQAALDAGVVDEGRPFIVRTPAGDRTVTVWGSDRSGTAWASVEMGTAQVRGEPTRCNVGHGQLLVDIGNPHLVILGPDPATVPVAELGPALQETARETHGINVEFVALGPGPDEITMRVWERGVGETEACGTGACAAAVALHHWGRTGTKVTVHQPGGPADVELRDDGSVVLAGPTVRIATIEVDPVALAGGDGTPAAVDPAPPTGATR
jgi:diaminopimelate epimerase